MEKKELTHKGSLKFLRAVKSVLEIFESETRDVGKTSSNVTALFGKETGRRGIVMVRDLLEGRKADSEVEAIISRGKYKI